MKNFIVLYHAADDAVWKMGESTPEDMEKGMEAWMQWAEKCGDRLVSMGSPLSGGQKISVGGKSGPSQKGVVGYSVLQASNMDEAKALLQAHPHLDWAAGCEIEVHESMPNPGQG